MSRPPSERVRDHLLAALSPHAGPFTIVAASSREWASGLFTGARHRIAIALDGDDRIDRAERLKRDLPELELDLRGGFVAEIAVVARLDQALPVLAIEALTIEDPECRAAVSPAVRRAG